MNFLPWSSSSSTQASPAGDPAVDHPPALRDQRVPTLPVIWPRALRWAHWLAQRSVRKQFASVRVSRRGLPPQLPDRPVLVYCNHSSLWTPAVGLVLAMKYWPSWRHYGPSNGLWMHPRLPVRAGFFSIDQGRRGARQFMTAGRSMLAVPGSMLWVAGSPQPTDPRTRPPVIDLAITHLARKMPDITLLPVAMEHPYWDHAQPETLVRFGEPINTQDVGKRTIDGWQTLLQRRLQTVMERLGEEAGDHLPGDFDTVI